MKVLDLHCKQQHVFEGWFASEDDFQAQHARGLVACPLCGDTAVVKRPSAPRLNFGALKPAASDAAPTAPGAPAAPAAGEASMALHTLQAAVLRAARAIVANTEDVGSRFAEEARRIHYGETPERGIRGQASRDEAEALLDEGIAVLPLPGSSVLKEPLH